MTTTPSALDRLDVLVGEWVMESKKFGGRGRTWVERSEEAAFVRLRSSPQQGEMPSSTWIVGADDSTDHCTSLYHDSRGVRRVYHMNVEDGVWKIWRSAPGFNQRYIGAIAGDGSHIEGRWEFSEDGSRWEVDFDLSYTRA
jgi:hypothetical protein